MTLHRLVCLFSPVSCLSVVKIPCHDATVFSFTQLNIPASVLSSQAFHHYFILLVVDANSPNKMFGIFMTVLDGYRK